MKLHVILFLRVTFAFVRARPRLLALEEHCAVNWYSEAFHTKEVSYGTCVYSDSQDKCDKGLSMVVDNLKGICARGISRLH